MLKSESRQVRTLLSRYANARIALAENPGAAWQRELAEVTRTLCAVTGTRTINHAIAAADEILAAAERPAASRRPTLAADTPLAAA
ncbi:DUF5133 domain-containing protein [Streptomyces sp. NPDC005898]|uniref:DUF5133 domain-containing protein n=1 Tax=Streptomyces sp. NPDC005898 TaxID=3157082 RepID=UPI0033EAEA00